MRRLPLACCLLLLCASLPVSARAEPAPPPEAPSYRFQFEGDTLVVFERKALPPLPAGREWALYAPGIAGSVRVEGDGETGPLRFVTLPTPGPRRAKRWYTLASVDSRGVSLPRAKVEEKAGRVRRREVDDADHVMGAVAAADPAVYDRRVPAWYLHAIAPGTTVARSPAGGWRPNGPTGPVRVRIAVVANLADSPALEVGLGEAPPVRRVLPTVDGVATVEVEGESEGVLSLSLRNPSERSAPTDPRDVSADRGTLWIDSITVDGSWDAAAGSPRLVLEDGASVFLSSQAFGSLPAPHRASPDPVAAARGADEVILATAPLLEGARRLADHRTKNGVRAVVVPVADVWDRIGGGNPGPDPLRTYLSRLAEQGGPRFVLLCGDATYDRTDLVPEETIPTILARTKYNGATAADRLLTLPTGAKSGGAAIGRLPFRDPRDMDAYVARVIAWETKPPPDPTRRVLRFVTSEGRFGPQADALIETLFMGLVDTAIPRPYEVEATYASLKSAYCWPPKEFNEKVISSLNAGSLCFTYVGHGWADGFDSLRVEGERYPILRSADTPRVDVTGTPPAMFVIACTTARFDEPSGDSVGELLLKRPDGPLAYFGATRICHPIHNSMLGRYLATGLFETDVRLGAVVQAAGDEAVDPKKEDKQRAFIETTEKTFLAPDEDFARLYREGQAMYALLGDPALRLPYPASDLDLEAVPTATGLSVTVKGRDGAAIPDGAEIRWAVETPRNARPRDLEKVGAGTSPDDAAAMKRNWAKANDKALVRGVAKASGGKATFAAEVPEAWRTKSVHAKAWAVFGNQVHQGSATTVERR